MGSRRQFLALALSAAGTSVAGCARVANPRSESTTVLRRLPDRHTLEGKPRVILGDGVLERYDLQRGQQVRVWATESSREAAFTIRESYPVEPGSTEILIGKNALSLIEGSDGDEGRVQPTAVSTDISTRSGARRNSEFIEQALDDTQNQRTIVMAPHGGQIEPFTALQAQRVSDGSRSISSWVCLGFDSNGRESARRRWYISPSSLSSESFPLLSPLYERQFNISIGFFGSLQDDTLEGKTVGVGGTIGPSIRENVRDRIDLSTSDDVNVFSYRSGSPNGTSPGSIVNRVTRDDRSSVEILQTQEARKNHWTEIANGVASWLRNRF